MSGDVAAAGNAATGAPGHGGVCLNCGTRLLGEHCHGCGQAGHVHRTVGAIGHEIAHGVFHFEGRIWRTLPLLVLRPGELTRRYVAGERVRFVSPLALFLFTVFLMFAVYGMVGPSDFARQVSDTFARADVKLEEDGRTKTAALAELERARAALVQQRRSTTATDEQIAKARAELRMQGKLLRSMVRPEAVAHDASWFERALANARANPGLVAYKVQSSAYKFSWALILLSTPFVALLFLWRRGYNLYDHAVFATYSIAFMSLLAIVLEVGLSVGMASGPFWAVLLLVPPVHMFAQLKGAYRLSNFSAAWRTMFLLAFSVMILLLFVTALVAMGLSH